MVGSEGESHAPDRQVDMAPLTFCLYGLNPLCAAARCDRTQGKKIAACSDWLASRTLFLVRNNDSRVTRLQAVTTP